MGIKPDGLANAPRSDTADSRFGDLSNAVKSDGGVVSEEVSKISAKAESSNAAAAELAADIVDLEKRVMALEADTGPDLSAYVTAKYLESLPLLLRWDGTGTKPQLKPGWGLFNTSTGKMEE